MMNIPEKLKEYKNFVVWGINPQNPKQPYSPISMSPLEWQKSENWGTFEQVMKRVNEGKAQGIGFCFNGNGIIGVDLDRVIIGEKLIPEAREIVEKLDSYTEYSMSGNGLHIFVYAPSVGLLTGLDKGKSKYIFPGYEPVIDESGKEKRREVEYFFTSGYIALTGRMYNV
jgi:putative DNA primase/helicase